MELGQLKEWIVTLALITLIGGAAGLAINSFYNDTKTDSTTVVENETVTLSLGATVATGSVSQPPDLFVNIRDIRNGSYIKKTGDCNITTSGVSAGSLQCNVTAFSTTTSYVNYSHYTPTSVLNITKSGETGLRNASDFFDTIGTVIGVAALLSLLMIGFYVIKR